MMPARPSMTYHRGGGAASLPAGWHIVPAAAGTSAHRAGWIYPLRARHLDFVCVLMRVRPETLRSARAAPDRGHWARMRWPPAYRIHGQATARPGSTTKIR